MLPHSRFWLFVLTVVLFLLLATAVCASPPADFAPAKPLPSATVSAAVPAQETGSGRELEPSGGEAAVLAVRLLLHFIAAAVGLRVGMRIFYESTLWRGFLAILLFDTALVAGMELLGPLYDGFTALLGPQIVVTGLFMTITLQHFGFTKDRFTVIPAVLVAKAFGFFVEVVLRMLFLDVLLRWATGMGL